MLSGPALAPYKVAPPKGCWWCGSNSLTSEHKFKRSDLTRMWSDDGLLWGNGDLVAGIRSLRKARQARFPASLCADCNNRRSQPFDFAYARFSDYVWANEDDIWSDGTLDLAEVFGDTWKCGALDLARYMAKHLTCRMIADGFGQPADVSAFLNGGSALPSVKMVLVREQDRYDFVLRGRSDGVDTRGLWMLPATGEVSRSLRRLVIYNSGLLVSSVGIGYAWRLDETTAGPPEFYRQRKPTVHLLVGDL